MTIEQTTSTEDARCFYDWLGTGHDLGEQSSGRRTSPGSSEAGRWCNLRLHATMDKAAAIEAGTGIAETAVDAYRALLPLYEACWP